jgi:hypothetical protein
MICFHPQVRGGRHVICSASYKDLTSITGSKRCVRLCVIILEYRTTDKVRTPSNPECHFLFKSYVSSCLHAQDSVKFNIL